MYFRGLKRVAGEVSLSDPIDTDKEGNALALMDVISCEDNMLELVDTQDKCLQLRRCIKEQLDDRERQIISMRYGMMGHIVPLTQREIAERCGISRSYVSRIEKKALKKLEHALKL